MSDGGSQAVNNNKISDGHQAANTTASPTQGPTVQQAQVPHMWNYQMYNMYGMYNMYQNYSHPYYQFLANSGGYNGTPGGFQHGANTVANNQQQNVAMEAYRSSFTSGGTLMPFNASHQRTAEIATSNISPKTSVSSGTSNMSTTTSSSTKVEEIELPPLPPGPPPPSVPPPPPPGPSPSPPPPPPPDTTVSPVQHQMQPQQHLYPQYMGFNMSPQQNMYNKNQYQQQFVPAQQQQQQQSGVGQFQSGGGYQGVQLNGPAGQTGSSRWGGGEKESRWSQPPPVRFNQPNRNNNRFNNQQDGPIRFNMRAGRGRLKSPLLPNPDWNKNKWNQGGAVGGGSGKQEERRVASVSLPQSSGTTLSDEETLRKLVDGWPDNLKSYVDRCFVECPPAKKDKLTVVLKSQLIKAAENGSLWCKQWQFEPLPELEDEAPKKKSMESRLGQPSDTRSSPSGKKKKKDRTSRGSGSESGEDSHDGYIGFSGSSSSNSSSKKNKKNKEKKKNKYKHNIEESHYWSEFGMNGGNVETKKEVLDKRAARFNNDKGGGKQAKGKTSAQNRLTGGRLGQQQNQRHVNIIDSFAMDVDSEFDLSSCHIVGTCRDIEKPYLRLTTAPEPCQVRPPYVLKESLDNVKQKWIENQDYRYVCEQLKSIRQDLTVQGIRDDFTVLVYETHARIALETGDHAEFNQCQSQLSMLHKEQNSENRHEFTAYRLLYFIFTQDFMDVNTMLMSLSVEEKKNVCIAHALCVIKAWLGSNYDKLFRLYEHCPRMSSYLMDWFMTRERKQALKIIIKSYRPTIPTELLLSRLAFTNDNKLMEFLEPLPIIYSDPTKKTIDCKQSTTALSA